MHVAVLKTVDILRYIEREVNSVIHISPGIGKYTLHSFKDCRYSEVH